MQKCDCYDVAEEIIDWFADGSPKTDLVSRCFGTKERDMCSCGGDRSKCDFYPDIRAEARKDDKMYYETKGRLDFVATVDDIKVAIRDKEWHRKDWSFDSTFELMWEDRFIKDIYHLMSGEKFLNAVNDGYLTNYDGCVAQVFVDGYISNLGLYTEDGFQCGNFTVDEELWLQICDNYKVEVNWANK